MSQGWLLDWAVEKLVHGELAEPFNTYSTKRERGLEVVAFGWRFILAFARTHGDDGTNDEASSKRGL